MFFFFFFLLNFEWYSYQSAVALVAMVTMFARNIYTLSKKIVDFMIRFIRLTFIHKHFE